MNRKDAIKSMLVMPALFTLKEAKPEKITEVEEEEKDNFVTIEGAMIGLVLEKHTAYFACENNDTVEKRVRELMTKYFSHIEHRIVFKAKPEYDEWVCTIYFKTQENIAYGKGWGIIDFTMKHEGVVFKS